MKLQDLKPYLPQLEVDEYRYCPTCGQRIDWSEQECTGSSEDEYNTVRNSKGE